MAWRVYNMVHKTPVLWGAGALRLRTADFFLCAAGSIVTILLVGIFRDHLSIFWVAPVALAAFIETMWAFNIVSTHGSSSPGSAVSQWNRIRKATKNGGQHKNWTTYN